jgi:hypothetical protein
MLVQGSSSIAWTLLELIRWSKKKITMTPRWGCEAEMPCRSQLQYYHGRVRYCTNCSSVRFADPNSHATLAEGTNSMGAAGRQAGTARAAHWVMKNPSSVQGRQGFQGDLDIIPMLPL